MIRGTLEYLVSQLYQSSDKADVSEEHLWYAIRGTINPRLLISNLAEVLRISATETEQLLIENGFGDLVAQLKLLGVEETRSLDSQQDYRISLIEQPESPFQDIFSIEFSPPLGQPIQLTASQHEAISLIVEGIVQTANDDAFLALYRKGVCNYHDEFLASDAKLIDRSLSQFEGGHPRYIVTTGIGADELFNHFLAHINNVDPNHRSTWLIIDSPRHLTKLPPDATVENTLFMEFSRSGKTEETVKIHEYTPREAKRIVFANSGPLREIGLRDNNLVLDLPDQVPGRFGRNKTPILLAPMHVAGMDTHRFWKKTEHAITQFDLSSFTSLPLQIAQFIYLYQQKNQINHIYLGCNDDVLAFSANELLQFWNEGVNKEGNDIGMSGYFGLLRDSHSTIEGILANHKTKMGIFLLRDSVCPSPLPPMTSRRIDPIDNGHIGLCYGNEETILAEANYQRFSELMPVFKIVVHGDLAMNHAAILGQLWADMTFCYSRMMNVDPGSNPEVKYVRERSAEFLTEFSRRKREG